ncbi:hypothetical protein PI124_g22680 [Phytophthora idaei]|nr:hypothetical protein PI125_g24619 [Phytophthora idaei]KAG3232235.1 hypothetical protein PI124_g22680 [Phytophthora idaei]
MTSLDIPANPIIAVVKVKRIQNIQFAAHPSEGG